MSWPQSQEYNEAIQSPASSFADPELRTGQVVTNDLGLPMPRSGNFADVYEVRCPNGTSWAVKCFTRQVAGLRERYQEISRGLQQAKLPFTVEFTYLEQGLRIRGDWYPILKMQWVEGFTLNDFIRQQLDKPAMLGGLLQIWGRMATRLRESGIAHADLQHGNVLLVPGSTVGSVAVKLIDYDGMFVPSLAKKKSGEVGHPSYQHPQRLREGIYNQEVDRFPLLLIATALRALKVNGKSLWDKYDNGDNLLFRQQDLEAPNKSPLFYELLKLSDPADRSLVEKLIEATRKPLDQTPLLEELLSEPRPVPVRAPDLPTSVPISLKTPVAVPLAVPVAASRSQPVAPAADAHASQFAFDGQKSEPAASGTRRAAPRPQKSSPVLLFLVGGVALAGMVLLAGVVGLGIWALSGREQANANPNQPKDNSPASPTKDNGIKKDKQNEKPPSSPLLPEKLTVDLGGSVKMEFVLIDPKSKPDGGKFKMGSPEGEKDRGLDEQQHDVELTKPYYLAKYPVTQEQYQALMKENPSFFQAGKGGADKVRGLDTKQFPVEAVSWNDAQAFCKKMCDNDIKGRQFQLPTEAEWEYACRAGTTTPFSFGSDLNGKQANCNGGFPYGTTDKEPSKGRTTKVGDYGENKWGLCDMHGNVWQWCEDYYGPYNDDLKYTDPLRSVKHSEERRVLRGGSWIDGAKICRAACRDGLAPGYRIGFVGFRVRVRLD